MKSFIKRAIKRVLRPFISFEAPEVKIKWLNLSLERRIKTLNAFGINTLFDIGANSGQYAKEMRKLGYAGKIISFEPLETAYAALAQSASEDENWDAKNFALGHEDTKSVINIAGNSWSSSILTMLPKHEENAPESKYVGQQEIEVKTLDSIYNSLVTPGSKVMLKIDTQGFEKNVIDGGVNSLKDVIIIQLEMSLVPLYSDEMLFMDMINYLDERGFMLFSIEEGFASPETGQLLQADGIFVRKDALR